MSYVYCFILGKIVASAFWGLLVLARPSDKEITLKSLSYVSSRLSRVTMIPTNEITQVEHVKSLTNDFLP